MFPQVNVVKGMVHALSECIPRLAEPAIVFEDEKFGFVIIAAKVVAPKTTQIVTRAIVAASIFLSLYIPSSISSIKMPYSTLI
jgi:hypothetical protein